jgi:hypothetical protein
MIGSRVCVGFGVDSHQLVTPESGELADLVRHFRSERVADGEALEVDRGLGWVVVNNVLRKSRHVVAACFMKVVGGQGVCACVEGKKGHRSFRQ